MFLTIRYKFLRLVQEIFKNIFTIPFGIRSRAVVKRPVGSVYKVAKDPESLDDLKCVLDNVEPGCTYFDVGANFGHFALAVHDKLAGDANIHCFEPEPDAFFRLSYNNDLNGGSWNCHKVAVGSEHGWLKVTTGLGGFNHITNDSEGAGSHCPVINLQNYIDHAGLKSIDFFKMDIEGYEMNVLNGASDLFKNKIVKKILVENDGHQKRYGFSENCFEEFFKPLGYERRDDGKSNFELWCC